MTQTMQVRDVFANQPAHAAPPRPHMAFLHNLRIGVLVLSSLAGLGWSWSAAAAAPAQPYSMYLSSAFRGIKIDTDSNGQVSVGDTISINVSAANNGSQPLTNVVVSDPQLTPNSVTCGTVLPGSGCNIAGTYIVTAADATAGSITNTASATSTELPGPFTSTVYVAVNKPGIMGMEVFVTLLNNNDLDANGQASVGDTLTYNVSLFNFGTQPLTNVVISDPQLTPSAKNCGTVASNTFCGMNSSYIVTAADAIAGNISTTGSATSTEIPGPLTSTASIPVTSVKGTLTIVSGNSQVLVGNTPSQPLVVQLKNVSNAPVVGATINWVATNGNLPVATSVTDATGRASNTVAATGTAAVTVRASSAMATAPVTFNMSAGLARIPGLTPPEQAVAGALDNACPALAGLTTLTPAERDLLAQCQALSSAAGQHPDQVANALNQMLPHDALLQTSASVLVATAQFDNIKARLSALRSGSGGDHFGGLAFSTPDGALPLGSLSDAALGFNDKPDDKKQEVGGGFDRWGFFATGTFSDGSADPRQATPGYGFQSGGLTAGVDYRVNDHMIFGVSAGYERSSSNVDTVGGGLDTHGWSLSAYSTLFRKDNWYADGVLTWGSNSYDITRRIIYALTTDTGTVSVNQTATSNSSGTTLAAALTLGRDFSKGPWSFGPYLRGTWSRTNFDGYEETLVSSQPGSGLGLTVASRNVSTKSSVLGAKVNFASSQSWGVMMPHAEIEWQHEFQSSPDSITARFLQDPTATPFQLGGDSIDTDFFRLGLGLSFQFAHGRSGFLYYEKTLGLTGITQNSIALGFRMEF